jgi:hypothetical protein
MIAILFPFYPMTPSHEFIFNVNGGEEEVYIAFLFVRGKYPI